MRRTLQQRLDAQIQERAALKLAEREQDEVRAFCVGC